MAASDLSALIPVILSAGGGAFVVALFQGWRDMRAGARAGQRETVEDLIRWRNDLDEQLRYAKDDLDFWRDLAATRGYQLRQAGIEPAVGPDVRPARGSRSRTRRNESRPATGDR